MTEIEKLNYVVEGIKVTIKETCLNIGSQEVLRCCNFPRLKKQLIQLEEAESNLHNYLLLRKNEDIDESNVDKNDT